MSENDERGHGDVLLQDGVDSAFYFRTVDAAYVVRNDEEKQTLARRCCERTGTPPPPPSG